MHEDAATTAAAAVMAGQSTYYKAQQVHCQLCTAAYVLLYFTDTA
jgi:hypothetical protein